jgi:shikimate kinase
MELSRIVSATTIALIGYRGTGKTTIAQLLALRLGYDWVDADAQVESTVGMSIAEFFAKSGEKAFRDVEAQVVEELCGRARTVLALGGGAVLREESRQQLADCGAVVWLKAEAATIENRIAADPTTGGRRPNLTNHGGRTEIEALLDQREPIYRACATLQVDTEDRAPAEIADEIVAALKPAG